MAVSLREYRAKIKSTQSMKKITRAMELIAASRIIKAQQHAAAAEPYARELTRAVSAVATFSNVDHPLTTEKENPTRAAVLIISSDRGLAGAYSSNVLKEAERLAEKLHAEGKEIDYYLSGRKAESYFKFRQREFVKSWTGLLRQAAVRPRQGDGRNGRRPRSCRTRRARGDRPGDSRTWTSCTSSSPGSGRCSTQEPDVIRLLPLEVVEGEEAPAESDVLPLYEFEPDESDVLDALLPKYVNSRIYFCMLQAAASELAARQKAMKSATDNAQDLIEKYTRIANQARQAGITQEISEIVGGANALADLTAADD